MTLEECLNAAADLIKKKGWTQHIYEETKGYCLAGAIWKVCPETWPRSGDGQELLARKKVTEKLGFYSSYELFRWNDNAQRTKEEVIARLRQGAKDASSSPETSG